MASEKANQKRKLDEADIIIFVRKVKLFARAPASLLFDRSRDLNPIRLVNFEGIEPEKAFAPTSNICKVSS